MKEKTQQELAAADRQVELITNALKGASADGYWLNPTGKYSPQILNRSNTLSPFNALVFALHSDAGGYSTSIYTSFTDSRKRNEAVLSGERAVPMLWYNWGKMVSKSNPEDVILQEDWQQLPEQEQQRYKALRQREVRAMFNIEQTTLPMADASHFETLQSSFGTMAARGNLMKEERDNRTAVNDLIMHVRDNLVPVRKSTTGEACYDKAKDAVYMPSQGSYGSYPEYVQDLFRTVIAATGSGERLARSGVMSDNDENARIYEALVQELASGYAMTEMGMPAHIKKENLPLVDRWNNDLRTNPCMIDALEADINSAMDVIRRAKSGEKIAFASQKNADDTQRARNSDQPQVTHAEALIIQDILAHGGMRIDANNFPGDTPEAKQEAKRAFMEKFCNLDYYESQMLHGLEQAKVQTDPEMVEMAYTTASNEAARIHRVMSEYLPKEWEQKGSHFIADEMMCIPDKKSREFMVIKDSATGIVDVVLPELARTGGDVVMPNGDRRNYWLTPDEVMLPDERKEQGAKVASLNVPGMNKEKITAALMAQGATYVRFYDKEGTLRYRPDDGYFKDKEVFAAKMHGKDLQVTSKFDVADAVSRATETQFERIQMLKDDSGKWALMLKPEGQDPFCVYPDREDTNRFFATIKSGDRAAADNVRNELAQKYYAMASSDNSIKTDLFYNNIPDDVNPDFIQRVCIFRTKDDKIMMSAQIEGQPKLAPREMTSAQWQRLWAATDVKAYKTNLCCHLFGDVLQKSQGQEQAEQQVEEQTVVQAVEGNHAEEKKEESHVASDETPAEEMTRGGIMTSGMAERIKQYNEMKKKHPDALLLFRYDDVYQLFQNDAPVAADILKLKVKSFVDNDNKSFSFVEIKHTDLDTSLPKLVRAGQRVAICEQLDDPRDKQQRVERSSAQPKEHEEAVAHKGMRM